MEERLFEVDGFVFHNEETANQAKKEIAGVKYLKNRADMENPEMVLQIYNKTVRENLFRTPIGIAYLRELQEYLYENPYIENSAVSSIPAYDMEKVPQIEEKHQKQKNIDFKKRYKVTLFFAVIFFIMIIAMFAITLTSDSPTIINYENEIINKYEEWEQELEQREQELDRREAEEK